MLPNGELEWPFVKPKPQKVHQGVTDVQKRLVERNQIQHVSPSMQPSGPPEGFDDLMDKLGDVFKQFAQPVLTTDLIQQKYGPQPKINMLDVTFGSNQFKQGVKNDGSLNAFGSQSNRASQGSNSQIQENVEVKQRISKPVQRLKQKQSVIQEVAAAQEQDAQHQINQPIQQVIYGQSSPPLFFKNTVNNAILVNSQDSGVPASSPTLKIKLNAANPKVKNVGQKRGFQGFAKKTNGKERSSSKDGVDGISKYFKTGNKPAQRKAIDPKTKTINLKRSNTAGKQPRKQLHNAQVEDKQKRSSSEITEISGDDAGSENSYNSGEYVEQLAKPGEKAAAKTKREKKNRKLKGQSKARKTLRRRKRKAEAKAKEEGLKQGVAQPVPPNKKGKQK